MAPTYSPPSPASSVSPSAGLLPLCIHIRGIISPTFSPLLTLNPSGYHYNFLFPLLVKSLERCSYVHSVIFLFSFSLEPCLVQFLCPILSSTKQTNDLHIVKPGGQFSITYLLTSQQNLTSLTTPLWKHFIHVVTGPSHCPTFPRPSSATPLGLFWYFFLGSLTSKYWSALGFGPCTSCSFVLPSSLTDMLVLPPFVSPAYSFLLIQGFWIPWFSTVPFDYLTGRHLAPNIPKIKFLTFSLKPMPHFVSVLLLVHGKAPGIFLDSSTSSYLTSRVLDPGSYVWNPVDSIVKIYLESDCHHLPLPRPIQLPAPVLARLPHFPPNWFSVCPLVLCSYNSFL